VAAPSRNVMLQMPNSTARRGHPCSVSDEYAGLYLLPAQEPAALGLTQVAQRHAYDGGLVAWNGRCRSAELWQFFKPAIVARTSR